MHIDHKSWDLVAEDKDLQHNKPKEAFFQKKRDLLNLVKRWLGSDLKKAVMIKTDLMEESVRVDDVLFDLSKEARQAFGMDISFKLTALAKKRPENHGLNIGYIVSDARKMSFRDNVFDFVLSNSTMDHFPEIEQALKESFRILKPGGVMVITIHNKLEFTFYLYHFLKKAFKTNPHFHFEKTYTPWEIRDKLHNCGFIIEDYSTSSHVPMGLWVILYIVITTAERMGKLPEKAAIGFINFIIKIIESLERKNTILNFLISLLIAFKVRKPLSTESRFTKGKENHD